MKQIRRFLKRTRGASLVEYSMVVGLIAVTSVGAVYSTGTNVKEVFCKANDSIRYAIFGTEPNCLTTAQLDDRGLWFGNLDGNSGAPAEEVEDEIPTLSRELDEDTWGEVEITIPIPGGVFPGPGPHTVRVTPGDGTQDSSSVKACSGIEGMILCNPQTGGGFAEKELDEEDTEFGYSITLPDDPRTGFSQDVLIEVVDGNGEVVYSSEETVSKPAASEIYAGIDENLGHWDIPAGTTGEYFIFAPVHNFNAPFSIKKAETGNSVGVGEVCLLTVDEEDECAWGGVTIVPGEDMALGVRIPELPSDTRLDADYTIALTMTSTVDPSVIYNLTATASREPEPVILSVDGTMFYDEVIPMGTTGNYYVKEVLEGSFNGDMYFDANVSAAKNHSYIHACYWAADTVEANACANISGLLTVPKDAYAIGYRISPVHSDINREMYVTFSDFALYSTIDSTARHEWNDEVTAERPQWEADVVARNSCNEHYNAGETMSGYFPISGSGSDMKLYCHFVTSGSLEGGWTMVSFNKDTDIIAWDEGVIGGFHARSDTQALRSYSLKGNQLPPHNAMAFGTHDGLYATLHDAVPLQWDPTAIWNYSDNPMQDPGAVGPNGRVVSLATGNPISVLKVDYHRAAGNHNPNFGSMIYSNGSTYTGLLSIAYNKSAPRWAFLPGDADPEKRGYALGGFLAGRTEAFGYSIFVR